MPVHLIPEVLVTITSVFLSVFIFIHTACCLLSLFAYAFPFLGIIFVASLRFGMKEDFSGYISVCS